MFNPTYIISESKQNSTSEKAIIYKILTKKKGGKQMEIIKKAVRAIKKKIADEKQRRYTEVRYEWIKFFEERERHLGGVQLPAFMLADQQMKIIMANNELNSYYRKIMNYRKQQAVA